MKDNKIINFIGASCVGKTSVIEVIKESDFFNDYSIINSISRKLLKDGEIFPSFNKIDNQKIIFDEYLKIAHKKNYLSDRCLIDIFTFTQTFPKDNRFVQEELLRQSRLLDVNKNNLGKIFYFPIYWDVEDDGERLVDKERRKVWDQNIQDFLKRNNISHIVVPNISVSERVSFIMSHIIS